MNKRRNLKAANSGTLETTENISGAVLREDFVNVDTIKSEEAKALNPKLEETKEESVDDNIDETGNQKAEYVNLCENMNFSFTVTEKLRQYSQNIFHALARKNKHTIFLVGDEGVGKRTVIDYLVYRIAKGQCPEIYREHKTAVYMVDIDTIAMNFETLTSAINDMIKNAVAEGVENLIVYTSRIATGIDLFSGMYDEFIDTVDSDGLMNFKIIATFDDGQYLTEEEEQELADFMNRNAVVIRVQSEELPRRILRVLKLRIDELERIHDVEFPQKIREILLMCYYGRCFGEDVNYSDFLNEVDAFLALVEVSGKSVADSNDIRKYYRQCFEIMSELSADYNYVTAIHESGHILIALGISRLYKLYGASILYDSQDNIEGITLTKKTLYMSYSENDILDFVTMLLAGRAAELEYCVKRKTYGAVFYRRLDVNRGSSSDIEEATDVLREWVIQNGAYKFIGYHLSCGEWENLTDFEKFKIDIVVKRLLNQAYRKAEHCVKENKAFIMEMHKFLLENITATIDDIREIAKRTIKKS